MKQNIIFSIEKLSAPIEHLNLKRRSYNVLKRSGLHKISQIIIYGKDNLAVINGMGTGSCEHISDELSKYLNVPENDLFSDEMKEFAFQEIKKKPTTPLNISIAILALPFWVVQNLNTKGVSTLEQLIIFIQKSKERKLLTEFDLKKIKQALWRYLHDNGMGDLEKGERRDPAIMSLFKNLSLFADLLPFSEKSWKIIQLRGDQLRTFREIGIENGGISKSRVGQIMDSINGKIQEKFDVLLYFCDILDGKTDLIQTKLKDKKYTISNLAHEFYLLLAGSEWIATNESLVTWITIIRFLLISNKPWVRESLELKQKKIVFLVCSAEPRIENNADANRLARLEKKKNRKLPYKELAYRILSTTKRPMHWTEIAKDACEMNKGRSIENKPFYNALTLDRNLFVRVDSGTYELREWGNKKNEFYPDIIAKVLKRAKQALSLETILAKMSAIRSIKETSLYMYLEMHPRFYKSINKTYGLRVWLSPKGSRSSRTPDWLIEIPNSTKRVDQALRHGYDITKTLAKDKWLD